MLYGNIIFIKKTGGDGSKYPVTEKSVKIGRSEECLIRIYNTQVALEHCQLIIGENGQATLKDLSNQTVLNNNILALKEATLCHGDVFKVGERLARWEYLPTSKYYRQLLSPTGRLVAVVMPQQRCFEDQPSGTSASFDAALKSTPVGGKRRYSERFASESASAVKMRKSSNSNLIKKSTGDLPKLLTGRYSLKTNKLLLPVAKLKNIRKSTSGINSSRTPRSKSRKSTLPSWKINTASPPTTISMEKETPHSRKSRGKSAKFSENKEKINHTSDPEPVKLSVAKKRMRSPQKTTATTSEEIIKSESSNVLKSPVEVSVDSPLKLAKPRKLTRTLSNSPSPKKPALMSMSSPKPVRLIYSEKKHRVVLTRTDKISGNKESRESFSHEELKSFGRARGSSSKPGLSKSNEGFPDNADQTPTKMRTSEKLDKFVVDKALNSSGGKMTTPRVNEIGKVKKELAREKLTPTTIFQTLNESGDVMDFKEGSQVSRLQRKSTSAKSTPFKKTPRKLEKSVGKVTPLSERKNLINPLISRTFSANSASARSPKASSVRISLRKTINLSKERISSPRGVRRKLSPSISSAERAAKELKTSSPKKPDKNKKAALLVLGKASHKQLLAQNVKVLLKQKIVKKAIKQSTAATTEKIENDKKKSRTNVKSRLKKKLQSNTSKTKKKAKKNDSTKRNSLKSVQVPFQSEDKIGYKGESTLEGNMLNDSKVSETTPRSPSKFKNVFNEAAGKSLSNQHEKSDSSRTNHSKEASSPYGNLEKAAESFVFNSNRRCSKRLSSKNDLGRPDFVELSPTALGLMPKNVEVFKTPKQNNRRSSSLATPKVVQSVGIIKSASTSKIGTRKNVRFSSKDLSLNSEFCSPGEKSDFDLGAFQTPNVSVDVFISPLGDKSSGLEKGMNESRIVFASEINSELGLPYRSNSEPRKCIRKLLQSPQPKNRVSSNEPLRGSRLSTVKDRKQTTDSVTSEKNLSNFNSEVYTTPKNSLSNINGVLRMLRSSKNDSTDVKGVKKMLKLPKVQKSPKNDLSDVRGVKKLLATPKVQKSPKNDLSDIKGVKKLLATPKVQKSPKNDLSDIKGVKKLLATPKVQKSPKNDLSDVRGVKKLLATPKVQKSPKNDLSDIKGVKKLLATPKVQKSPKNDLSDVRGVKKLLATPKVPKSPKNDLSDVRGVKKLLATPKVPKSPKNDLSDVRGVKKLLATPKVPKSPKNDLSDVRGVKKLLATPKVPKSPKNDLSDVRGVKKLLATPKIQKSPKNDLSDVRGVKKLLRTPRVQKSPKYDLNVSGVKELFRSPRVQRNPKNELLELSGIQQLFESPKHQRSSESNSTEANKDNFSEFLKESLIKSLGNQKLSKDLKEFSEYPQLDRDEMHNILNIEDMKEVPETRKNRSSVSKPQKSASRKSRADDFKSVKGRRSICSTPKEIKNDLSDVTGLRELFARHELNGHFDESLTGVAQLFNLAEEEGASTPKSRTYGKRKTGTTMKVMSPREKTNEKDEKVKTRMSTRGTLRKALGEETTKSARVKKSKTDEDLKTESTDRKQTRRKAAEKTKASKALKSPTAVKRSERLKKGTKESGKTSQARTKSELEGNREIKTRKRKAAVDAASPPPKLSRKRTTERTEKTTSKSKTSSVPSKRVPVRTARKASAKVKDEKTKSSSKVQKKASQANAEQILKVQKKRSQSSSKKNLSDSQENYSPIKTRSVKRAVASQQKRKAPTENKTSGRKKLSPVVKKSTRRK